MSPPPRRKILGLILLLVPLGLIVAMTVDQAGWRDAIMGWAFAVVFTVSLVFGIRFLLDDP